MTVVVGSAVAPGTARPGWPPVRALAAIEARRIAISLPMWAGWLGTLAIAAFERSDWPGAAYNSVLPVSFAFLVLGTYLAALRIGGRDHATLVPGEPLAEAAALGSEERLRARLAAVAVPAVLSLLTGVAMLAVVQVEGGLWMGEGPRRTDSAQYLPIELIQPVLLVALAGAVGVVLGRVVRRSMLAVVLGVFAWTAWFPLCWLWNGPGMHTWALVQVMPLRVPLPDVTSFGDTPTDWWVESPTQYEREFTHAVVHAPTILLHDVFLVGLLLVAVAGAIGRRALAVRLGGAALAVVAVVAQLAVSPF